MESQFFVGGSVMRGYVSLLGQSREKGVVIVSKLKYLDGERTLAYIFRSGQLSWALSGNWCRISCCAKIGRRRSNCRRRCWWCLCRRRPCSCRPRWGLCRAETPSRSLGRRVLAEWCRSCRWTAEWRESASCPKSCWRSEKGLYPDSLSGVGRLLGAWCARSVCWRATLCRAWRKACLFKKGTQVVAGELSDGELLKVGQVELVEDLVDAFGDLLFLHL